MAEIVRLLRWRAEWDGADLVDGAGKAAAAGERLKKSLDEVGAAGPAALKKTSVAAKEADGALEGLGLEAKQVEMYLGRLEKGSGSPLVLQRNAELAEAALNVLAFKAADAGQALDEAFSGRVLHAIDAAKQQAAGMNAELEKMGGQTPTKLDKVITALEKTEQASAGTWDVLRKLGEEGARAAAAMEKLGRTSDEPTRLGRAAGVAELEVRKLADAMAAATRSGAKFGPDVAAALDKAQAQIKTATTRTGELRDAMGDVRTRGDLAARSFESAASSAGSLEGMLGKLKDTSGPLGQAIADTGFKVVALGTAFQMGVSEGKKLRGVLTEIGVPLPDLSDKMAGVVMRIDELVRGYQKAELVENAAVARAREIVAAKEAQGNAEYKAKQALESAIPGWQMAAEQQGQLRMAINAAAAALEGITKIGGDWRKEVEANQGPLTALAQRIAEGKVALSTLPQPLADAIAYLKQLQGAVADTAAGLEVLGKALSSVGNGDVMKSIDAVAGALARIRTDGGDVSAAFDANAAGFQKLRDAAEKSYETLAKFRTEIMDQLPAYQATALTAGDYVKTIDEINAAYERLVETRRAANEADIEQGMALARLREEATQAAYAIDTIGESWARATGQAAGFTVEVRRGTQAVEESNPHFNTMIEELAQVSDEYERMIPWIGSLIAQLEKGTIGTDEFLKVLGNLERGFIQLQGVSGNMFGPIGTEFARLTEIVNKFVGDQRNRERDAPRDYSGPTNGRGRRR